MENENQLDVTSNVTAVENTEEDIPEVYPRDIEDEKPAENKAEETPEEVEPQKYNVADLLKRHEDFKAKGLQLTDEDLFNRLSLMDEIILVCSNMKAEYLENKLALDKDKALKTIELKMEKNADGKANTDKMIEAYIKNEYYEQDLKQTTLKNTYELLYQRAGVINDLVNVVKLHKKADFTL